MRRRATRTRSWPTWRSWSRKRRGRSARRAALRAVRGRARARQRVHRAERGNRAAPQAGGRAARARAAGARGLPARRALPLRVARDAGRGRSGGGRRSAPDAAHRRQGDRRRPLLSGRGRVPTREAHVIGRALRTFLGVPLIALAVIPFGLAIALAGESELSERFLRGWCRLVLFIAGVRVVARVHALDRSRSYVFVSNHTSNIDVPAIVWVSPEPLRFIAKQELARIPLFGWAARRMGHVFIDRRDSHGAAKAIGERLGRGLRGAGLFFLAEGTRSP